MLPLIRSRLPQFVNRVSVSRGSIWLADLVVPKHRNVLGVLDGPEGKRLVGASNIVTNAGDQYYAERAAGQTPAIDFTAGGLLLGTGVTAPAKTDTDVVTEIVGSAKAESATYPKTNDPDADNTGAGVDILTWLFEYTKADFNATGIAELAIVNNTGTPTSALARALFGATFDKTANDTLKVFVNHTFNGT